MRKVLLILFYYFFCTAAHAQYTYRGQVFSVIRQEPVGFGVVRLPSRPASHREGKYLAKIDSLGFFSFSLKDTSEVWVVVDCMLMGSSLQRLFYSDTTTKIFLHTDCPDFNSDRAKSDIQRNKPQLLCYLGYASNYFSAEDSAFEKKYHVTYYTFADEPIWSDCMWLYNTSVAEYLDKKYGDAWRKEVRWDVPFR